MSSKQTRSGYWKAYYAANRERKKAAAKQWALDNPERTAAYWKAHYAANRDKDRAAAKEWRLLREEPYTGTGQKGPRLM